MQSTVFCFDFDGTLIDSRGDIARAVNRLREREGYDSIPQKKVTEAIGGGAGQLLEDTFPDDDGEILNRLEEFREIYRSICTDNVETYRGISSIVGRLTDHSTSIVTNKPLSMTEKILEEIGWRNRFDPVFGADSFERMKPDPKPLTAVGDCLEVEPSEMVMIGDSWTDVQAGNAIGATTVACLYGLGNRQEVLAEDPDHTVESTQELSGFIEEIL